jgi:hypothetical protein
MTARKIASTLGDACGGAADCHCVLAQEHSNGEIERLIAENTIPRLPERDL